MATLKTSCASKFSSHLLKAEYIRVLPKRAFCLYSSEQSTRPNWPCRSATANEQHKKYCNCGGYEYDSCLHDVRQQKNGYSHALLIHSFHFLREYRTAPTLTHTHTHTFAQVIHHLYHILIPFFGITKRRSNLILFLK